jgi:hypothetical protein
VTNRQTFRPCRSQECTGLAGIALLKGNQCAVPAKPQINTLGSWVLECGDKPNTNLAASLAIIESQRHSSFVFARPSRPFLGDVNIFRNVAKLVDQHIHEWTWRRAVRPVVPSMDSPPMICLRSFSSR